MTPMRRRTSSAVIAAAPPSTPPRPRRPSGGWRCAATGTVSTASSRFRRYRITGGLEKGSEQTNAPGCGGPRPGAPGFAAYALRLTPLQLRLGPRLVLRRIAFRLDPRLALGGRGLAPRLGAGGGWTRCGCWRGDRRLGTTDGWLPPPGPFGP